MLQAVHIENYKSIEKLTLPLGRINVFIGENGAGKSNILEAIALAGAAHADKLDNEFLASRGIRVSSAKLMRSAFSASRAKESIKVSAEMSDGHRFEYDLTNDNKPYSSWRCSMTNAAVGDIKMFAKLIEESVSSISSRESRLKFLEQIKDQITVALDQSKHGTVADGTRKIVLKFETKRDIGLSLVDDGGLQDFIIYAPENSALRLFEREGQIEPLGINGEGLLKLLRVMSSSKKKDDISAIKESLKLFSWFRDFKVTSKKSRHNVELFDQFFDDESPSFDQRSANEGFLFVTFYLALFTTALTPRLFAVDNVDASLNPKLCEELMRRLVALAKDRNKQVLITTHNPAILDGLDLGDSEQRLFIVSRGADGQTRVRRFEKKPSEGKPRRLSELFLGGALGGLPKGF